MSAKTKPSDFLKNIIGRPVLVKLNSGVDYRGMLQQKVIPDAEFASVSLCLAATLTLSLPARPSGVLTCLDGYMNIALEQTEEYVNGQLRNKYGDAFIRGNNGMPKLWVDSE
jgi:U6 snRNA-associated Sm-like protein LSm6